MTHLYYDPMGRLYRTTSTRPGYGTTVYLHDGDALVAEYDAAGTMLRRHVHGAAAGVDDPLATFAGSATDGSTAALLKADPRGSIVATTDWNGNLQVINTYDVYGIPGSANSGRFQYTGQVWLPEIGMYYYKARMYSPTLGRFMQTDPIGYEDDSNLYAYVGDDPVNGVDFTGMCERGTGTNRCGQVTEEVRTTRVDLVDKNKNSNEGVASEIYDAGAEDAKALTEQGGFKREYAVTLAIDPKRQQYVITLWRGPPRPDGKTPGGVTPSLPSAHQLLRVGHTHTTVGVGGVPEVTVYKFGLSPIPSYRGTGSLGPSEPDEKLADKHPEAEFELYIQTWRLGQPRISDWQTFPF